MVNAYSFTHSVESDVSPEAIWALYEDVTSWPRWDAQAELAQQVGPMITADFPDTMASLIALAKERSS